MEEYEFSFSSIEDLRRVLAVGSWNLAPWILRLFSWTPDFNPYLVKQTDTQCWIRIIGLPQEYWRPRILFAISRGIGIPLSHDDATINKYLGHYARVLVDIDLAKPLQDQILVEREGYTFLVGIDYEKLPQFCSSCAIIGHTISNCNKNRLQGDKAMEENLNSKKIVSKYVPKPDSRKGVSNEPDIVADKGDVLQINYDSDRANQQVNEAVDAQQIMCKGKRVLIQSGSDRVIMHKGTSSKGDQMAILQGSVIKPIDVIEGPGMVLDGELREVGILKPVNDLNQ